MIWEYDYFLEPSSKYRKTQAFPHLVFFMFLPRTTGGEPSAFLQGYLLSVNIGNAFVPASSRFHSKDVVIFVVQQSCIVIFVGSHGMGGSWPSGYWSYILHLHENPVPKEWIFFAKFGGQ